MLEKIEMRIVNVDVTYCLLLISAKVQVLTETVNRYWWGFRLAPNHYKLLEEKDILLTRFF